MIRRAVVFGGAGYVGAALTNKLLAEGVSVLVFDNLSVGSMDRLNHTPTLSFIQGDITDYPSVHAALYSFQPDTIFHLAATHFIPECNKDPQKTITINVVGTTTIIRAIRTLPSLPKTLFVSSASIYGNTPQAQQRETDPPAPCDIYGFTKLAGERLVVNGLEQYVIARLFNVYGEDDPTPHLIPSIYQQLEKGHVVLGNTTSKRDFIFIQDAAEACIALMHKGHNKNIYNIGTGVTRSVLDVCSAIQASWFKPITFASSENYLRKEDPSVLCADISKLIRDTGWSPSTSFKTGLRTINHTSEVSPYHVSL